MVEQHDNPETRLKIDILLKEYDTLRTDMLQRINARFVILGFLGALLAFVLNNWEWQPENCPFDVRWPVLIAGLVILLGTWWKFGTLILLLGTHINSIEKKINQLAGEELLTWGTYFGCRRFGKIRKINRSK